MAKNHSTKDIANHHQNTSRIFLKNNLYYHLIDNSLMQIAVTLYIRFILVAKDERSHVTSSIGTKIILRFRFFICLVFFSLKIKFFILSQVFVKYLEDTVRKISIQLCAGESANVTYLKQNQLCQISTPFNNRQRVMDCQGYALSKAESNDGKAC